MLLIPAEVDGPVQTGAVPGQREAVSHSESQLGACLVKLGGGSEQEGKQGGFHAGGMQWNLQTC